MGLFSRKETSFIAWHPQSDEELVQCYSGSDAITFGQQLVVQEGQVAIFRKGGVSSGVIMPGTHSLVTGNVGGLFSKFFGDNTRYSAEVWFVSTTIKRDLKWGTPQRIDFDYNGFPVRIGAFGSWGIRVRDPESFVRQITGGQRGTDSQKIYDYFTGRILECFTAELGKLFIAADSAFSISHIAAKYAEISSRLRDDSNLNGLSAELARFGIELVNFDISNINVAQEDQQKLQAMSAQAWEMKQLSANAPGAGYFAAKQMEILKEAAKNLGSPGMMAGFGTGLGLGAGFQLGGQEVGRFMSADGGDRGGTSAGNVADPVAKLSQLKKLFEQGILTEEEYYAKRKIIVDEL